MSGPQPEKDPYAWRMQVETEERMRNDPYDREHAPNPPPKPKLSVRQALRSIFFRFDRQYEMWEARGATVVFGFLAALAAISFAIGVPMSMAAEYHNGVINDQERNQCRKTCEALDREYKDTVAYGCVCKTDEGGLRLLTNFREYRK